VVGKKHKGDNDEDDLTKDMEDPPAEPNVAEVNVSKPGKNFSLSEHIFPTNIFILFQICLF